MPLTKQFIAKLRKNNGLQKDVKDLLQISEPTMREYLRTNHENFTRYTVLTAIASEYNVEVNKIIEPSKAKAI